MAERALGTTLSIGADITPVTVAGLTSIGGLELTADTIDVTTLDSDDGYREFIAGFKDAGEVTLEGYLNSVAGKGQKELHDLYESGGEEDFAINFSEGSKWTFTGIVTGFGTSADLEDPLAFSATIKVTGQPTFTVAVIPLSVDPVTATFDKNEEGQNYKDIEIEIKPSGVTLTSVHNGENELTLDTDYTVTGLVVTLLTTYLETLGEGEVTITFTTNKGNVSATIVIEDTTGE